MSAKAPEARKNHPYQRARKLSAVLLTACLTASPETFALEFTAATELGATYNSNARRSSASEDSDVLFSPTITADAFHQDDRVSLAAGYRLERRLFRRDFFEDQNRVTGYANVNWEPILDRFDIRATQNRNETTRQSFGRGTQDDRQIVSTSEIAPRLRFQVLGKDELQLEYAYTLTDTDDERIDSDRQTATARYVVGISESVNFSLSGTRGETEYQLDDLESIDFTTYLATINYLRGRNTVEISGGESTFEREGQPDTKGPVWDVTWTNQLSTELSFSLGASRQITDRSQELQNIEARDFEEFQFGNSDLTDIFENRSLFLEVRRNFGATNASLRLEQNDQDFEVQPRDQDRQTVSLSATRQLRRALEARGSIRYDKTDFDLLPTDNDQFRIEASVLWDVNRRFETEGGVFLTTRDGDGAAGDFDDYGFYLIARFFFAGQNALDLDR